MTVRKRFWSLGLVGAMLLILLLAACSDAPATSGPGNSTVAPAAGNATTAAAAGNATTQSASSSSGGASVTVNWWHIQTTEPQKTLWNNIASEYMKAHPNVKIVQNVIANEDFKSKLTTVMQSGNAPDLFQSWGGGVLYEYGKAGLVKDLTPSLQGEWGSSISKAALDLYSQGGKTYGVPFNLGAVGFWYNKALFQKAGITSPPATWADFLDAVKKLKAAGITPISLGGKDKWPGMFYYIYLAVRLGGKDAFEKAYNRTGSFSDPAFVQAGQKLKELIALDPFPQGMLGVDTTGQSTLMGSGKAAMELMGQWAPATETANDPNQKGLGENLGFFPFPTLPDGKGNATDVLGGGDGYAVGKNAPAEAIDFLKFFTSVDNQRLLAQKETIVPVVKGSEDGITNPLLKQVQQMVSQATYLQLYYDQYLPPAVAQAVLDGTQGIFAASSTPEQAAQSIEDAAKQTLTVKK